MEMLAKARSDTALQVGEGGMTSSKNLRVFFNASSPFPELERGKTYWLKLYLADEELESTEGLDEELAALTKAQLIERLMVLKKSKLVTVVADALSAKDAEQRREVDNGDETTESPAEFSD